MRPSVESKRTRQFHKRRISFIHGSDGSAVSCNAAIFFKFSINAIREFSSVGYIFMGRMKKSTARAYMPPTIYSGV